MLNSAKLAEPEDVRMCYRLFLRREPESVAVVQVHLRSRPTIWQLIQSSAEAKEHEPIKIDEACSLIWQRQDGRNVRVEASATAEAEILAHVEQIWSAYGTEDPYYSVLTNPAYRADNITSELTEHFYQSGSNGLENMKLAFERNRMEIDSRWHVLDLGCGVGRIGEHFCRHFDYYYGVDISANHLALARERFKQQKITNSSFVLLKDASNTAIIFDIFYSMIVLQHNPPPVTYRLLDMFFKKLKHGGFAFFQLPCHLYGYGFSADRYLSGHGKHNTMEMHALPQNHVFEVLHKNGLRPIEVWPFPVIGPIGISYVFFARKDQNSKRL